MMVKEMKINVIKDREQKKALKSWIKQKFVGSVIAATGFGKSRVGVIAVGETLRKSKNSKGLVLVPTIALRDQFEKEFVKWGYTDVLESVEFICYQSAYKLTNNHYNVIVCDEIHLGLSVEYRKFFENNTYNRLLCMTATPPEDPTYRAMLQALAPIVYNITLDECVDLELVAPYEIYCIPVELTKQERIDYAKCNKQFVYYKYCLGDFNAFDEANRILASKTSTQEQRRNAVLFYQAIRNRKAVVDFASNKIKVLKQIALQNINKKILTFSGANAFTDAICEALDPLACKYHSKVTLKNRRKALEDFKEGNLNILCSTKALNQGVDIPEAEVGIICGLTSKSLTMIQRVGRLVRFKEDKIGKVIVLYVANSQEEKWLKNSIKNLKNLQWIKNVNQLNW